MLIDTILLKIRIEEIIKECADESGTVKPEYKYRYKTLVEQYTLVNEMEILHKHIFHTDGVTSFKATEVSNG